MKKKTINIYKTIMLMIVTMMVTFILTTVFVYNLLKGNITTTHVVAATEGETELIQVLNRFRELIDSEYIGGKVDDQALMEGAIKGYVEALGDPYSVYYTAEEMEDVMAETTGNYVGVGIYIGSDLVNDVIYLWPMEGSPAEKAGIQNDDILLKVNDVSYHASEVDQAVNIMKAGQEGEEVKIQVKRGEEILDFVVKKEAIVLKHVTSEMLADNIGLIKIESFEGEAATEFKEKYEELKQQGMERLIVDVRDNGGGIVQEALKIADYFLEKDQIILVQTGKDGEEKISKSENDPIITEPVVVLINESSASASEIFAAALKENERATLIGTTTYGKGVIQTMRQFTDGSGIKLTTDEFLTPKKNKINGVGVEPDIEVQLDSSVASKPILENDEDNQLQRAIEEIKKK